MELVLKRRVFVNVVDDLDVKIEHLAKQVPQKHKQRDKGQDELGINKFESK